MLIFNKKSDLSAFLSPLIKQNKSIGFVPTMGALHQGHLSLLKNSLSENDVTVMSIFVNPTQFNNAEDLDKYPRTLERDVQIMQALSNSIIVYAPEVEDIYEGNTVSENFEYDGLENQMEGKHRPGHFDGVGTIVKRLFEIVQPNKAYFGEKDFQQLQIVKKLVSKYAHFELPKRLWENLVKAAGITEETKWEKTKWTAHYGITKMLAEREVWRGMQEGLEAVIVNPGIIVGYSQNDNKATMRLFQRIANGKMPVYTNGTNGFVSVEDVADICIQLMNSKTHSERFIVVGENISFKTYFEQIAKQLQVAPPKKALNKKEANTDGVHFLRPGYEFQAEKIWTAISENFYADLIVCFIDAQKCLLI